jgi:HK97 family phage portal protein
MSPFLSKILWPLRKATEIIFNTVNVDWYARNGYTKLYELLGGGGPSWSGISINEKTALNCSVVWACIRTISDPIGFLPLRLYKRVGDGRERATDHPLYYLLHDAPNEDMSALDWRSTLQSHALSWGNGFSQVIRRTGSGEVIALEPLPPDSVFPGADANGKFQYRVKVGDRIEDWDRSRVFHLRGLGADGLWGYSVISLARQSIGLATAMEKYGSTFFANGGRVPYVLEHPGAFKTEEAKQFREDWEAAYGRENWHRGVVLHGGMKYQQIGLKPEDAQFLASRQFQIPDICRWFKVSPHLAGDLSRATFSNIEQLGLDFLTQTLSYWLKAWEQAISRCLLTPAERKQYYAEFDVNALLRGDYASRTAGYATLLQNGVLSVNDVRRMENMNSVEDGDNRNIQLNMQPLGMVAANASAKGVQNAGTN